MTTVPEFITSAITAAAALTSTDAAKLHQHAANLLPSIAEPDLWDCWREPLSAASGVELPSSDALFQYAWRRWMESPRGRASRFVTGNVRT